MLKSELIEINKNLIQQNGSLMYLLDFGKLRCEDSKHQMIWERDSNAHLLQQQLDKYKEVIEEVREYVNNLGTQDGMLKDYKIDRIIKEDLLQILDKAKEGNNE